MSASIREALIANAEWMTLPGPVPGMEDQHAWTIITSANYKRNYILKSKP